jgi:hypothetical protein
VSTALKTKTKLLLTSNSSHRVEFYYLGLFRFNCYQLKAFSSTLINLISR